MGKRYDAEEVSTFMADLCSALNGYEAGANSLEAAYNKYVHNTTFKGVMADTAKRCIDHGQRNLHKENLVIQNKLLARYKDMKDLFEYMVDSSPKARIDTDVLEDVKKDFQGYRKVVSTHGENIEDIAKYLQDNFSEDCDVDFTQPSYQEARDAYSKFSGPKGFIDKTIEKFEEFDEEACAALTRSGIQAYIYDYQQELRQIGNNLLGMNPATPKVDETILKSIIGRGKALVNNYTDGYKHDYEALYCANPEQDAKVDKWLSPDYKMTPEEMKEGLKIANKELSKVVVAQNGESIVPSSGKEAEWYNRYVALKNKCSKYNPFIQGFLNIYLNCGIALSESVEDIIIGGFGEMGADSIDNIFDTNFLQQVREARQTLQDLNAEAEEGIKNTRANAKIQDPNAYVVGDMVGKATAYFLTSGAFNSLAAATGLSGFALNQVAQNLQDLALDTTSVYSELIEDGGLSGSDWAILGQNVLQNAMYNILFWEFGEVADIVFPKKASNSVELNKIANGAEDAGDVAKDGSKPLSEMTDSELEALGYKRHPDGSIRDSKGHFAGNSGTVPGTPGVDATEQYLVDNGYTVKGREITVRSADGTARRYDIVVEDGQGNTIGIEVKSGSATRTNQQVRIDNELNANGGLDTVGAKAQQAGVSHIDSTVEVHVDAEGNVTMPGGNEGN